MNHSIAGKRFIESLAHRDFIIASLIGVLALLLSVLNPAPLRHVDGLILDWYFNLRGSVQPATQPVALVMVDDPSIDRVGRWPWPRAQIGSLFTSLSGQYAPRTVVSDLVFPEAERNPLQESARWLQAHNKPVPAELNRYVHASDGDRELAAALNRTPSLVQGFYYYAMLPDSLVRQSSEAMLGTVNNAILEQVRDTAGANNHILQAEGINTNLPMLAQSGEAAGFLNFSPDHDGSLRIVPLLVRFHDFYLPSLSLAAASRYLTGGPPSAKISAEGAIIHLGDHDIVTSPQGLVWVNYYGPTGTVPTYSAVDILSGTLDKEALRDKLVFIGVTAAGSGDVRATPLDSLMPGTEVQAQIALNLINNDLLRRPTGVYIFETGLVLFIWLGYGLFFRQIIERSHGLLSISLPPLYLAAAYAVFLQGIWLQAALGVMQLLLTFILLFSVHYSEELLNRRHLRHTFESFVDPSVVDEVADRKDDIGLGGEERDISVMFIDLAGFTTLSERLEPQQIVQHINAFFDAATPIVFQNKGCIDRLTGDGLVALFGAPIRDAQHAENACRAALQLEQALLPLRDTFEKLNHPLRVRAGINSGMMVIGNMGSTRRMQYTFMGDSGNAAARLEALNKDYGSLHMIGEPTYRMVGKLFVCRELDTVLLRGKRDPLRVYELLGESGERAAKQPLLDAYAQALDIYRRGDFTAAADAFAACAEQFDDAVSRSMQARCQRLASNPPPDWCGVWNTTGG
ncbi:MAG: hypothetical protein COS82_11560 [Zetaproteobacteria bacterium CG06_land_8_20_14_3_00_59_53]|nr:MAG: hypothetical protein AUK36_00770 [Zetaproteobacteria bacterium CG2_30_59_37]PIO90129.1 MAG: hypothetical protein COX56_04765 [Zetaproteobacteria bacterium CG23_combo_of_CG06-09_8_20_14_all_59_86]PIQ64850.1 MAG: hypothetical protein COV97_07235 [Zetaproteobacteria bacterium CG11_big_fil_rev_8_21_14_0_20_59_439]PIU69529.1 MAG: hypothetical protein COS82_11560 [Zetaproteobacteria bacterium CG06_land_8_20_14_3_00_59_53]PIU96717.1 MAG: hypothetical protein COS62_06840 [Zetaproteobacteria bac